MTLITCHGALEPFCAWPVDLEARTVREALLGLAYQLPEFRKILAEGRWHVMRDGLCCDLDTIDLPAGAEIIVLPEAVGEGGGDATTYAIIGIGVVLIGASLFVPGSTALVAAGYSASFVTAAGVASTVAFSIGVSLVLTGVSQMLAPDPPESDTSKGSTLMGGVVNTTSSDVVVPVLFGRGLVGSVVTSAGISTVQLT